MMRKAIRYFLLLNLICSYSFGQQPLTVSGKVVDSKTNEPLAFVNIGVEGTLTGTASNTDGEFILKIPMEYADKNLYFSAIGYENYTLSLANYLNIGVKIVALKPQSYDINDVEISTASKVLYRIVRDAVSGIQNQYVIQPYACKALYKSEHYIEQVLDKKRDALVQLTDCKGYRERTDAFKSRNYQFINMQRNFDISGLSDGTTLMDDLLSLDIARTTGNILDTNFLNDYNLQLVENLKLNEDSVWVIAYNLVNPDLSHTGDFCATEYKGKLFISKKSSILLKAEATIKSSRNSPMGRSIATESVNTQRNVAYNYTATYRSTPAGYSLDGIVLQKTYTNIKGQNEETTASLSILDIDFTNPPILTKRQYFEKLISDPDFWIRMKNQFQHDLSN